jgi:hypothetical protein
VFTTDDSQPIVSPFHVNFDGAKETIPAVATVGTSSGDQFLVACSRSLNGVTSLTTNLVDLFLCPRRIVAGHIVAGADK